MKKKDKPISEKQWRQVSHELRELLLRYFKSPAQALSFMVIEAAILAQDHIEGERELSQEDALSVVISQARSLQESAQRIKAEDDFAA